MNKIEKFLSSLGIKIFFKTSVRRRHYGGRSFYNDGFYWIDFYTFEYKGNHYEIGHKSTGRPMYELYINGQEQKYDMRFSQTEMIKILQKKLS